MERYEHKVVLITGAGDIAGATARRLLSEGGKVALTDFSREALDQEARMLKEEGGRRPKLGGLPGRRSRSKGKVGQDRRLGSHGRYPPSLSHR